MPTLAITGGDVSGKTESVKLLPKALQDAIQFVPEIATAMMSDLLPKLGSQIEVSPSVIMRYQSLFRDAQLHAEDLWKIVAAANGKKLICCDRGIPDLTVYDPGGWPAVCQKLNLTKEEIYARYDYVIVMRSLATINPALYEQKRSSNPARTTRTVKEAQDLDRRTHEAWLGHPNLIELDGTKGFEYLVHQLEKAIRRILGKEIEKKYVQPAFPDPSNFNGATSVEIRQGYLTILEDFEERLRRLGYESGELSHVLTYKGGGGVARDEDEHEIASWAFDSKWPAIVGHPIEKTRLVAVQNGRVFEIDTYFQPDEQLIVEVNFGSIAEANQFVPPDWMAGAIDVTDHPGFKAKNVAKSGKFPTL